MTGSVDYILVSDVQALTAALSELSQSRVIGVDTETTGLDPLSDKLHLVQLAPEDPIGSSSWICFALEFRLSTFSRAFSAEIRSRSSTMPSSTSSSSGERE